MATRRARMTVCSSYVQPLKVGGPEDLTLTMSNYYNSVLLRQSFKPNDNKYASKVWAKYDSTTFDGIHLIGGLFQNGFKKSAGSCEFKIYAVSLDDSWSETLLATVSGVDMEDGRFKATVSQGTMSGIQLDGEQTILVETVLTRQSLTFRSRHYFNHLGSYEYLTRLNNKVTFLELTKLDE